MATRFYIEKVTPPTAGNVIPRRHLLNGVSKHDPAVIWISAPSGFGKTVLAQQIATQYSSTLLWYNVESIDQDPALFFGFIKQAAIALQPECGRLADFSAAMLQHLDAFTPRFFAELTDCLDTPVVLVMDDYQHLDDTAPLHGILTSIVSKMPDRLKLVITSRRNAPPIWARVEAEQQMLKIGQSELSLTAEETEEYVQQQSQKNNTAGEISSELMRLSGGWISGIKLLLGQMQHRAEETPELDPDRGQEALMRLFSAAIFEQQDTQTRNLMLRTSYLPFVPAWLAAVLSGQENAEQRLNNLYQSGFFTSKRVEKTHADKPAYVYHDLLRSFLRDEFNRLFNAEERQQQYRHAAECFLTEGFIDQALDLLIMAEAWHPCMTHLLNYADKLFSSGQLMTLHSLLHKIPEEVLAEYPKAQYWYGLSMLPVDMKAGLARLETAYEALKAGDNITDTVQCWAAVVDAMWGQWLDCKCMDYWIDELERFKPYMDSHPEIVPLIAKGAFAALSIRDMAHPEIKFWEKLNLELLEKKGLPLDDMLLRGTQLLTYYTWGTGNRAKASLVLQHLGYIFDDDRCSTVVKCIYHVVAATYENWFPTKPNGCLDLVEKGLTTSAESGLPFWDVCMINDALFRTCAEENRPSISHYLEQLNQRLDENAKPSDIAIYYYFRANLWWLEGQYKEAFQAAEKALSLVEEAGFSFSPLYYRLAYARLLADLGQYRKALSNTNRVKREARANHSHNLEYLATIVAAGIIYDHGPKEKAMPWFTRAIEIGAAERYAAEWWISRATFNTLCEAALDSSLHRDYLQQRLAESHALTTAEQCVVNTLGRLEVVGGTQQGGKKLAKVPYSLLLHLIAVNHGNGITVEQALEFLWPDVSTQQAYPRLKTAVQRLRKILGDENTVRFAEGRISLALAPEQVDCWMLESYAQKIAAIDISWREHIFQLYQGSFQSQISESTELATYRTYIDKQFSSLVLAMARKESHRGEWESVLDLYGAALKRDPLNEMFLRGKLEALLQLGRDDEARHEFTLSQKLWQSELGIPLSPEIAQLLPA